MKFEVNDIVVLKVDSSRTLFEVSEINTITECCTLKRVEDNKYFIIIPLKYVLHYFKLASEIERVLYGK